jgi:hypothetical protein
MYMLEMKTKWFEYLSEQNDINLKSIMIDYFNDKIDIEQLNNIITEKDLLSFHLFKKEILLDNLILNLIIALLLCSKSKSPEYTKSAITFSFIFITYHLLIYRFQLLNI